MSKKSIEDRFSIDMDAYLNGVDRQNKSESEEYKELLKMGKALADNDFSENSNKNRVYDRILRNIDKYEGEDIVKTSRKFKHSITKVASIALACVLGFSIMRTASAQEFVGKVLKTISLGHITVSEEEPMEVESFPVPEKLKGKLFDKDGNPIEEFSKANTGNPYTADGEKIADFDVETGEIITVAEAEKMRKEQTLIVKDPNELNDYTCFDVILPSYLPEGYKFDRAEFYKDGDGVVENTKYIDLYFTNEKTGKYIFIQQRDADEETGYSMSTDAKIEQVKINGVDAAMVNGRNKNIHWEANGVLYMLSARGEVAKDELIKIAESIK